MELTELLATLHRDAPEPSADVVAGDLARGRRARHRRRQRQGAVAAVATLVVGGGATYAVVWPGHRPAPSVAPTPGATDSSRPAGLRLVAYTGAQKPGFTVTTVPEDWVLQGTTEYVLAIARPDDRTTVDFFVGKIVVTLVSVDESPHGAPITVGGRPGHLGEQNGVRTIYFTDDLGHQVSIQAWSNVDVTDGQLIRMAEGVTVTSDALNSQG